MDGGTWQATVHGVTKSRTRLTNLTSQFNSGRENKGESSSILLQSLVGVRGAATSVGGQACLGNQIAGILPPLAEAGCQLSMTPQRSRPHPTHPILHQNKPRAHYGSACQLGERWHHSHHSRKIQNHPQLYSPWYPLCGEVTGELVGNSVCLQHAPEGFLEETG